MIRSVAALGSAFALSAALAFAAEAETRQLDAHQHGHGALNIAFEGTTIAMELEAPGADIVGFEHPAESDEDRALIAAAIAQLAKPLELFGLPADAGCTVIAANVSLIGGDEHEEGHDDHHGDEERAHDDHEDHDDRDHADGHDEDHHGEHADHEGEEGHTEFHAEYAFTCSDPAAVDEISFTYFSLFPNAEELDIQMISDKGAKGFEIGRDEPVLPLAGMI